MLGRGVAGADDRAVAGDGPRIAAGAPVDAPLTLRLLLEEDGTLLSRWTVERP